MLRHRPTDDTRGRHRRVCIQNVIAMHSARNNFVSSFQSIRLSSIQSNPVITIILPRSTGGMEEVLSDVQRVITKLLLPRLLIRVLCSVQHRVIMGQSLERVFSIMSPRLQLCSSFPFSIPFLSIFYSILFPLHTSRPHPHIRCVHYFHFPISLPAPPSSNVCRQPAPALFCCCQRNQLATAATTIVASGCCCCKAVAGRWDGVAKNQQ